MNNSNENFKQVNTNILEDWGLMFVEPAESIEGIFDEDNTLFVSTIRYKGNKTGVFRVLCQGDFMNMLAANLLGSGDQISESDGIDAVSEMANVACGNLLTTLFGTDKVFDLTPPEVQETDFDSLTKLPQENTCAFIADDCPVVVSLIED